MSHFNDIITNLDILYKHTKSLSFAFCKNFNIFWCNRELEMYKYGFISTDNSFDIEVLNINKKAFLDEIAENHISSFSRYIDMFEKVTLNICKGSHNSLDFYIVNISKGFEERDENQLGLKNSIRTFSNFFREIISSNDILLNVISNMLDEETNKQKDSYMEKLIKNNFSLLRQISNINLIEHLYKDISMDDFMKANFRDYFINTLKSIKMIINDINIPFSYTIESTDVICCFSPEKMTHVITNLVSNSFLFTQDGNKLNIKYSVNKKNIILTFTDNGIGIKKEDLNLVRQKFFTCINDEINSGVGLGLSIVDKIISIHGGSMIIESDLGEGTTVVISIPIIEDITYIHKNNTPILSSHQRGYIKDKFSPLYVNLSDFIDFRI